MSALRATGFGMCELGRSVLLREPERVTRLVDRLESRGLVERAPCAEDRRVLLAADGRRRPPAAHRRTRAPPSSPASALASWTTSRTTSCGTLTDALQRVLAPAWTRLGGPLRSHTTTGLVAPPVKIGIVVPFSWSFWGAVVEHAELQAAALEARGHDVRLADGQRPAGAVHPGSPPARRPSRQPAAERHPDRPLGDRPGERLAAQHRAQPPRRLPRQARPRARARSTCSTSHEPMTPARLHRRSRAREGARSSRPTTRRAISAGCGSACPGWGFLMDRVDQRIAVSQPRARLGRQWLPAVEVDPERRPRSPRRPSRRGRSTPSSSRAATSREGAPMSSSARGRRSTGAPVRGSSSRAPTRSRPPPADAARRARRRIEIVGFLSQDALTDLLRSTKALLAPSLGGESFGMVLTRAFACATPVVASDIEGYREVDDARDRRLRPPGRPRRPGRPPSSGILADEPRRAAMGAAARRRSRRSTSRGRTSRGGCEAIYERVIAGARVASPEVAARQPARRPRPEPVGAR